MVWTILLTAFSGAPALACEMCAIYRATEARKSKPGWYVGLFEQYTSFGTLRESGEKVDDPSGQYLHSSNTQFLLGYQINERFGLQLNVPYIYRTFRRPVSHEGDPPENQSGTVNGLGDVILLGSYQAYQFRAEKRTFLWYLQGGIKIPTGSTSRLKEELEEHHTDPPSAVHGHDLTLGTGSWDGLFGASVYARHGRLFGTADFLLTARNTGVYDYRFADEWSLALKPGYYLWLSDEGTLGLSLAVIGETKGKDTFQGEVEADTGLSQITAGPQTNFTWHENLAAELAVDFPVVQNNTGLQLVPDYRVRAAVSWRF
jgi:hypothetical protein